MLFPLNIVDSNALEENAVFLNGLFAVLAVGLVSYYRKRKEYSVKIRRIVKIGVMIIPLIFVGAVFVGIAMGISGAFFTPSFENTKNINTDLFEKKVLDWVNTSRYKNDTGGVNLDDTLNNLAKIRGAEMAQVLPEEAEAIGNIDANDIAKREGIKCMINGKSANIYDYIIIMPHNSYPDIEKLTNFLMTSLTSDKKQREIIFA